MITDQVKALQCDRCQAADKWKCSECLSLPSDVYDHLVLDHACGLRWFCMECDNLVMDTKSSNERQNNEKFDNLTTLVESLLVKLSSLMERYELTEKMLEEKCSVAEVVKLESRISPIEAKVFETENKLDHLVELEARISQVEMRLTSNAAANDMEQDGGPPDEELIKVVVQEELNRKTAEEKDIENRKRNIIIYRIPEKRSDSVVERRESDWTFVKDLLDGVFDKIGRG